MNILHSVLIIATLAFISCSHPQGIPVSEESVIKTTSWLDSTYGVVHDENVNGLLRKVTSRLSDAASSLQSPNTPTHTPPSWEVYLLASNDVNAFSLGRGIIFITQGLLLYSANEAELASIISHEMAHEILGHNTIPTPDLPPSDTARPIQVYTLDKELAADQLGLTILNLSGYNLNAALSALSIGYRTKEKNFSESANDISKRVAAMNQVLLETPREGPATLTTRDFIRAKSILLQNS